MLDLQRILSDITSSRAERLRLSIPETLGGTMARAYLPGLLRKVRMTAPTDGSEPVTIYTSIQRAFARLSIYLKVYERDVCEETKRAAQFQVSLYSRVVFQSALWKCREVVNSRDAECTSSCFLVGRPMAFLSGESRLRTCEIAVSRKTANGLGVRDGQLVQLRRFPETRTLVVRIVVMHGIGDSVVGLPVGSLMNTRLKIKDMPSLLGADADGDTMAVTVYHMPPYSLFRNRPDYEERKVEMAGCLAELEARFVSFWSGVIEYPEATRICYSWKDESPDDPMHDRAMFASKVMQKLSIGVVSNTILCLAVAKNTRSKLFANISWENIRDLAEKFIETVMDMKKGQGRKPLCGAKILMGQAPLDPAALAELEAAGVDIDVMIEACRALDGKNVRTYARYNKPLSAMLGNREAFEAFVLHYLKEGGDPLEFARYFSDVLYGFKKNPFIKGTEGCMVFPTVKQSEVAKDRNYQLRVYTLNGRKETVHATAMDCDGHQVSSAYDTQGYPTLLHIELDTLAGMATADYQLENNGSVISLGKGKILLRDTVYVPYILSGSNMRVVLGDPIMLTTWDEILTALAHANFEFVIRSLKSATELEDAQSRLANLMESVLRRLLADYETSADTCSYATAAGQKMIVNLDTRLPEISSSTRSRMIASGITPANNDPVALAAARCEKAGLYLLKTGRISRLCDTTSGRPGMVFYSQMEDGQTFVAQQCPIPQFISNSQRPKINAAGNLQPFEGEEPPVYDLGSSPYAPSHPVWAIAMPINLMDAFLLSDALSEVFKIKIFQQSTGQYKTYKLEDGQKFQTSDGTDLKGIGCLTPADDMPWLQLSNGQLIRADVVFSMESKSHRLLRMTHFGMVLAAVARMAFLKTGTRMKVPADLTAEDICTMGIESRLYDDDNLTVTVLSPDKSTVLGKFPAGLLHLGMHKQVPSVVSSVHPIELYEDNSYATTTETGGVVAGLMGALTMWAEGLFQCCRVLHGNPPPARAAEIAAMIQCLEYRPLPSVTEETADDEIPLASSSSRF